MCDDQRCVVGRVIIAAIVLAGVIAAQDDCATAIPIVAGFTAGSTVGLVTDTPSSCGTLGNDIWFVYSPTCNGQATASVCTPGLATFDTIIAVYDGSGGCSSLVPLACNDNACTTRSSVTFPAQAGGTYFVALGGVQGATGAFTLALSCAPALPNDECANALPIGNGPTPGTNVGATNSPQVGACGNMGSDVWYSYTAPCSGLAEATFCQPGSASFDTILAVFDASGGCSAPALIACNDDTCLLRSRVFFPVTVGGSYLIEVGGFAGLQGTFSLFLSCHMPPPEDDCSGAIPIGLGTNGPFSNQFATDGMPPPSACPIGFADLWFTFAPPCAGRYRIETCGSYDTILSVHTACAGGTEIACNDDGPGACAPGSSVEVDVAAGATVLVRVAAGTAARGSVNVSVSRVFQVIYDSQLGGGSVGFTISGAFAGGIYFNAITLTAGSFPNGAFYGVDMTPAEIQSELSQGYPFVGPLNSCGDSVFPAVFAPSLSGVPVYSVGLSIDPTLLLPVINTAPVAYLIP